MFSQMVALATPILAVAVALIVIVIVDTAVLHPVAAFPVRVKVTVPNAISEAPGA